VITTAETLPTGDRFVTARTRIDHPMADEVSIALGDNGYCNFPHSVELAFFMNGEWVSEVVPEFAEYADALAYDTRVYGWVPLSKFASFLATYSAKIGA